MEGNLAFVTKIGASVAALTGAVAGLVSFFKLGWVVIVPTFCIGLLIILGYFAYTAKRRTLRITLWVVFAVLVVPVIAGCVLYVLLYLISGGD
jgi:hypothetical protein